MNNPTVALLLSIVLPNLITKHPVYVDGDKPANTNPVGDIYILYKYKCPDTKLELSIIANESEAIQAYEEYKQYES